jgi:hypothetical protein
MELLPAAADGVVLHHPISLKPVSLQVGARTSLSARCPDSTPQRTRMSALRKIKDAHLTENKNCLRLTGDRFETTLSQIAAPELAAQN